jgi:DNA-binding GntR family transcriptional regulator
MNSAQTATRNVPTQVVYHHLSRYVGKDNGIHVRQLVIATGLSERDIRSAVSKLREEGVAVVATPESGYYIAETSDELAECCRFLRSRAMHTLHIEARLRQCSMAELLGQLSLDIAEPANDKTIFSN